MIIGIIGGGQLGLMMAEAAKKYNHIIIGLDPNDQCPLSFIADEMITADYYDEEAISKLVDLSDVVTYEFENVNLELVSKYENKIPQKRDALYFSRNRLIEKGFAGNLGIPTPKYFKLDRNNFFYPAIIKTTTGGYDGKGQWKIENQRDVDHIEINNQVEYVIEEIVEYDFEISVIVTRDFMKKEVYYPIPINSHRNGILFTSTVFNEIDPLIVSKAKDYTSRIVRELDYIGTLAVEYFVKGNDVIFNEFAPRPHNSGHYTIEGCNVSQFENHIHAITNESVIEPYLQGPTIMINVLGQDNGFVKMCKGENLYHHDYRKSESKNNRKMGHITIVSQSKKEVIDKKNNIIKE